MMRDGSRDVQQLLDDSTSMMELRVGCKAARVVDRVRKITTTGMAGYGDVYSQRSAAERAICDPPYLEHCHLIATIIRESKAV
jgi:hypothetical protein